MYPLFFIYDHRLKEDNVGKSDFLGTLIKVYYIYNVYPNKQANKTMDCVLLVMWGSSRRFLEGMSVHLL